MRTLPKGKGYAFGLSSVILSALSAGFPFWVILLGGIFNVKVIAELISQILLVILPPAGFAFAFVGRVRSESGTQARKLSHIGAAMGVSMSLAPMFSAFLVLWEEVSFIPTSVGYATACVDTILLSGYWMIAYIRGKVFWFI